MSQRFDEPLARVAQARRIAAVDAELRALIAACPAPDERTAQQRQAVAGARRLLRDLADDFLHQHAQRLYDEVTAGRTRHLRMEELCAAVADAVPGLTPTREQVEREQELPPARKEGLDIDQSILIGHFLRAPDAGRHLLEAMRRPTGEALRLLPELERTGGITLDSVRLECDNGAAHLTMQREDCLNAEDVRQVRDMEIAVDLALLAPSVRVGVIRGGVMTHPKYAGRRVFSSGINLKCLHAGQISLIGFLLGREMGYLAKMIHGLTGDRDRAWDRGTVQKPWLAAVDSFAIGGGAQLMLACDRVIAERDAYFSLPAAQEGIIPGAGNLRLGKVAGGRLARQVILAGRRVRATEPEGALLFDRVVASGEMEAAIKEEVSLLDSPAVFANRRMLNLVDEPQEEFRRYMAAFTVEQARRLYSEDVLNKVTRFSVRTTGSEH